MTIRSLHIVLFAVSSLLVAWCGSYVDAFVLPMDETSARALGAPGFAYRTILVVRLATTALGCVVFAVTYLLLRRTARDGVQRDAVAALLYGVVYSTVIFGLGELAVLSKGGAPVILTWVTVLALPMLFGRRLARAD
jgi:hypothetical protein